MTIEQKSARAIGKQGYKWWSNKETGDLHNYFLVPQTIGDGWEIYCSCGEYRAFINFYQIEEKAALIAELKRLHALHCEEVKPHAQG